MKPASHAKTLDTAHDDDHHVEPVPRDPDLPTISDTSLGFFAAGALVVFTVALVTLFG
jgi:hypothetical protein